MDGGSEFPVWRATEVYHRVEIFILIIKVLFYRLWNIHWMNGRITRVSFTLQLLINGQPLTGVEWNIKGTKNGTGPRNRMDNLPDSTMIHRLLPHKLSQKSSVVFDRMNSRERDNQTKSLSASPSIGNATLPPDCPSILPLPDWLPRLLVITPCRSVSSELN